MDISALFSLRFWFSLYPGYTSEKSLQVLGAIFLSSLFLFIILSFVKRKAAPFNKKAFAGLSYLFLSFGLTGFAWLFFLYEEAYLLGARFWLLIIVFGHLVWLARIFLYVALQLPKEKEKEKNKKIYRKYLP